MRPSFGKLACGRHARPLASLLRVEAEVPKTRSGSFPQECGEPRPALRLAAGCGGPSSRPGPPRRPRLPRECRGRNPSATAQGRFRTGTGQGLLGGQAVTLAPAASPRTGSRAGHSRVLHEEGLNGFTPESDATSNRAVDRPRRDDRGGRLRGEAAPGGAPADRRWLARIRGLVDRLGHAAYAPSRRGASRV